MVVAGASAAPAFSNWVELRTGKYDTGVKSERNPKSPEAELWRMDSPDLAPQLRTWVQDYPLAPGYTLDPLINL